MLEVCSDRKQSQNVTALSSAAGLSLWFLYVPFTANCADCTPAKKQLQWALMTPFPPLVSNTESKK